jgi:DNA-directed RNA polymerase specialized sigma24 family protein
LVGPDKLSVADAARVLDISPAAFRVRLTRARKALRQAVAAAEAEEVNQSTSFLKHQPTHFGVVKQ